MAKRIRNVLLLFLAGMYLFGCALEEKNENEQFETFTRELFCSEVSSNTISLHYTLQNPEEYGIENAPVTFGTFSTDARAVNAGLENLSAALEGFAYKELDQENQLTYDILESYVELSEEGINYILYAEPMNSVNGVQTQIPVLLSEFSFDDEEDVEIYLQLLKEMPEYFASLVEFERAKSDAGLFMPESLVDTVLEQCQAFVDMGDGNYLIATFVERVQQLEELSEKEKSDYIQENARCLEEYVIPSYEMLITEMAALKDTGYNEEGLCNLPEGKGYYEYIVAQETGSSRSIAELKELTRNQIVEDLESMEKALGIGKYTLAEDWGGSSEVASGEVTSAALSTSDALLILSNLEEQIEGRFPDLPETQTQVKMVPDAMQEHLSPAFYMIPEIDNLSENVIYLNEGYVRDDISLFTTLAHEGYPGHLYQTVYYASLEPDPIRNIFNFGGYVEGWATYAEMCSYYLADLPKVQATFLQKNASIMLGLYTLADIGIHYDGWSREDTWNFFSAYGITDQDGVNRIYDLILGDPANYLKYYIGYVEFLELKKEYAAEAGDAFSQKEFHKKVLDVGPAPFDVVEKYMN